MTTHSPQSRRLRGRLGLGCGLVGCSLGCGVNQASIRLKDIPSPVLGPGTGASDSVRLSVGSGRYHGVTYGGPVTIREEVFQEYVTGAVRAAGLVPVLSPEGAVEFRLSAWFVLAHDKLTAVTVKSLWVLDALPARLPITGAIVSDEQSFSFFGIGKGRVKSAAVKAIQANVEDALQIVLKRKPEEIIHEVKVASDQWKQHRERGAYLRIVGQVVPPELSHETSFLTASASVGTVGQRRDLVTLDNFFGTTFERTYGGEPVVRVSAATLGDWLGPPIRVIELADGRRLWVYFEGTEECPGGLKGCEVLTQVSDSAKTTALDGLYVGPASLFANPEDTGLGHVVLGRCARYSTGVQPSRDSGDPCKPPQ